MKVFHITMGLIKAFLLKIFPSLGYQGVINTQISVYNKLKKWAPEMPENDLLNHLIISRIKALPRVASKEEEYAHYTTLLENPYKTLEDVIWAIVEYEYILSREEHLFNRLSKMGLPPLEMSEEIERFRWQVMGDIEESIEKKVGKMETSVVERTWKPTTAGILTILGGYYGIPVGADIATTGEIAALITGIEWFEALVGGAIALGAVAVTGGIHTLRRKVWGFVFAGAILAAILVPVGPVLGILALIFVSIEIIGAAIIGLGIVAIIGGIFALRRKVWGLALAGAICATPYMTSLGILALIFVSLGKKEFA